MKRLLYLSIVLSLIGMSVISCSDETPQPASTAQKPATATKPPATAGSAAPVVPAAPLMDTKVVKRPHNPFEPPVVVKVAGTEGKVIPKGPLECCDTSAFSMSLFKTGSNGASAILVAPDKKRYIVKVGTRIGNRNGKITRIDERGINVRQVVFDEEGNITSSEDVLIQMPSVKSGGPK